MSIIVFIYFLALLLLVCANTSKTESLELEDGELDFLALPSWTSEFGSKVLVNVDSLGAVGDGISDDTKAFADAWKQACSTEEAVLLVPPNRTYLVNATRLKGPCADNLIVQIDGTLKAPDEPKKWDPRNPRIWLYFNNITGVIFQGNGVIDGSGEKWWAASCKKNKTNPCVGAPTALTIDQSSNIVVNGLTVKNSQQMHFTIARSESVRIFNVVVSAPGDSPNTDGIHLTSSKNIDGTLKAPDEPKKWDPRNPRIWLYFNNITGVIFQGNGVIDGSGEKWWAASCKKNKTNPCVGAPTALTIDQSSNIVVNGLTVKNSQQMHFTIARSESVRIFNVVVSAPGDSPNTDGIHLTSSKNVVIQNTKIGTGDDCISIVSGCSNIKMKGIYCGPGHGISIGSLGNNNSTGFVSAVVLDTAFLKGTTNGLRIKTYQGGSGYVRAIRYANIQMVDVANPIIIDQFYCDSPKSCPNQAHDMSNGNERFCEIIGSLGNNNSTGFVSAVVLDTAFLKGTTNGLRIKTYQGGSGYVRAIRYANIQMVDVANPIIIDQFYCDSPKSCPNQTSAVEISQIMYQNISGTSKSPKAIKFSCSDTVPCHHIVLNNINLKRSDGKAAETFCNSAQGFAYGNVQPSADCLMSSNDSFIKPCEENNFKTIIWFSSTHICSARRGKYNWRHSGRSVSSMYKKKGWHHRGGRHQVNVVDNSKPQVGSKFNVLNYGAKGDGKSDDTKAFQAAWANACKVEASTMIVPSDYKFLVGATSFSGSDCQKNIIFQIDGTILAPTDSKAWGSGLDHWLEFTEVVGFTITGKGNLDGRGSVWWTKSIYGASNNEELVSINNTAMSEGQQVRNSMNTKMPGTKPMALKIVGGSDVTVTGITIQNSPFFHLTFDNCDGVLVYDISISSPGDSPNTDGIHLTSSKNVIIHHTNLACGDDCISIQTGCKNVLIHDVNCGPGHGISIGSLGIDGTTACVSNITVKDVKIHDTMTGVRIKTWQGAAGLVRGVLFSNVQISEVEVPIIIDQYYCDHTTCKNQSSAVSIANIAYENIRGTYTIQPPNGHQMSKPFCWNAYGKLNAPIVPEIDCLQEGESSNNLDLDDSQCKA
ncbi:Glycoside hydrolase, family 28 [Artemisia annua]|uniref:Glycoside hydrolase, family 28 n=1 Tax=Artemisia annua TaxID=35608 RepID=A0A2U1NFN3_ARTAN|nr:Glycoside hydrolase, family 28 [Artemisia annua]